MLVDSIFCTSHRKKPRTKASAWESGKNICMVRCNISQHRRSQDNLASSKYKKGDLVIIDDDGSALEVEIISPISARGFKVQDERIYDVKEITTGEERTISEDQILRLATPVDNSARLFSSAKPETKR